jgi:hypothetical protein
MAKSGIIYKGGSRAGLGDVITWHDQDELRVWIHSREGFHGRYEVGIEIQVIGPDTRQPSEEEKRARLKLATLKQNSESTDGLRALTMRTLPTGALMAEHSQMVGNVVNQNLSSSTKRVELVEEVTSKNINNKVVFRWDTAEELKQEGAKSADTILIAKIYEIQQAGGTKRLALRTAELLGVDVSVVHVAVQIARRHGWLTSRGTGLAGGTLTEEGKKKFNSVRGSERLARIMNVKN